MVENVVNEVAIGGEAGVVDIVARHRLPALIGGYASAAGFFIATIEQELVPDMATICDPHEMPVMSQALARLCSFTLMRGVASSESKM